ncbi:tRNA 2-selenouridine(34) synthase MnmH [Halopseudomonas salegens]|uniref:tRNA 2-selenouridine synthase n=1 Tax=Halopseudomonas salegens TaxID=1434072 RepID=A0A1H2FRM4_9GAMM|nr:tRNA 2-selenouridine(34) synthase MnmH [Halopseudomonas salegens]SDU09976.1 tRNA 2-selenouridine synthase [Halopseudomonas salegens]
MRDNSVDYRQILLNEVPLFDVRAPVEFAHGSFPGAINLPLMDDTERAQVGTCYKREGQAAAIALGHRLVSGELKASRIAAWADFARTHPDGYLYCFRGGLRSQLVQQWLADAGIEYPRIVGGYKAMRRFLIDSLDAAASECSLQLVAGLTGTGKTEVLQRLANSVDLEHHAHHRGSSFGRHATPQPGQIDFENALVIEVLQRRAAGFNHLVLEDEGRIVGRCNVPLPLYQAMQQAPLVWLEDSFEQRTGRILQDYVLDMQAEFAVQHPDAPEAAFAALSEHLLSSLLRIRKRLGGERHQRIQALMQDALALHGSQGDVHAHRDWIAALLQEYYDPMYAYQRENKQERVVFSGDADAVVEYLQG